MTTGKSVLLIGNFLSAENVSRQVCEELEVRLKARGWRVVSASRKRNRMWRLIDFAWTAWSRRREYDLAVVDVFSGAAFFWAETACAVIAAAGRPFALALHGGSLPQFAERHPRRVKRLLGRATAVTAPSRYLRDGLATARGDIQVLPNGLELSNYAYRVRTDFKRLVWLRAFERIYNPGLAVDVLAELAPEFPDLSLTMVGPDKDGSMHDVRSRAAQLGLRDRVEFPGRVPKTEVPRWLDRGDIFLNTTNVDNMPVSVIEAMACGLPVVSTAVGGVPYLIEHDKSGLLVPPSDPQAMADAVRRLLKERSLADRLARAARSKIEVWDWDVVLPQWEALLERMSLRSGL
jgi:glycosyltransferase involved in cell wall biosynthesis